MLEDAELLRRYADENSNDMFAEVVRRHVNFVYACALRRVGGDAHLAKDVTQFVFTALARSASSLAQREVLSGWLFTTARNAAAQIVRTERRRQAREHAAFAMNELTSGSEPDAEWQQLRPMIDDALDELNEHDRQAVLLRFFENNSFAEVGAKLRLTENAARMRVERALDKLHAVLGKRGATSTTAALSIALANQPAIAAPAGLGASVVNVALASTGGVGGSVVTFMSITKIVSGVVAACAVGAVVYQTMELRQRNLALGLASAEQKALATKLHDLENRFAELTLRSQAVEEDNGKLLKVVEDLRTNHQAQIADTQLPITRDMVAARFNAAKELARRGDGEVALTEFLWCYDEGMLRVASYGGVRQSYLLGEIAKLGENYPAALAALRDRRDQAKRRILASTTDLDAGSTFCAINRVLKEEQATLVLYDQLPAGESRQVLANGAYPLLVSSQRYVDAAQARSYGRMSTDFEVFAQERPLPRNTPDPEKRRAMERAELIASTAEGIEVLAGAGDLAHARLLAAKLLALDGSDRSRAAIQKHAERAGHPELLNSPN